MRWIRVEVAIGDSPMLGALADTLSASVAEAVGLHALVWAKLPEHASDGALAIVADTTLERWATWQGKRGTFAKAYRATCCDEAGNAREWERVNGAAMRESAATTERVKKLRLERKANAEQKTERTPRALQPVRRTLASTHAPDGDGTVLPEKAGTAALNTDLGEGEPSPQNGVENSVDDSAYSDPSPVVTRFMAHFYRDSTRERRADVARQMSGAIIHKGVTFKGETVRAVDETHLDDCCLEVMEDPPRDPNAAWVFVLQRLKESYLRTLSDRAKALTATRPVLPEGMTGDAPAGATPLRAAIAGVLDGLGITEEPEGDE